MAEVKSREELEAEWWATWHEEDFTWEGLKNRPFEGWVVADGYLCDPHNGHGYGHQQKTRYPSLKKQQPATLQDYWRADPATGQLRDVSNMSSELVSVDGYPTYHCVHLPLTYEDGTSTSKVDWEPSALDKIAAERLLAAKSTSWAGDWFDPVLRGADGRAQFQGGVWLQGAAHLQALVVSLYLRYERAYFSGDAEFDHSTFDELANFFGVAFAGRASFSQVNFSGRVNFNRAILLNRANFYEATFVGYASFDSTTFAEGANFYGATFGEESTFDRATLHEGASFGNVRFSKDAHFREATFTDYAGFENVIFSGSTSFDKASFGPMFFNGSKFIGPASFSGIAWPSNAQDWHGAFLNTIFQETVTFRSSGLRAFAAFDGAIFERSAQFDAPSEQAAQKTFERELRGAGAAALEDAQDSGDVSTQSKNSELLDARLGELERGCRVLKQVMEKSSDKSREQLLYRFELKARRAKDSLPFGEKSFSYLYSWTSDYGASIIRPVIGLFSLLLLFGLLYWGVATSFRVDTSGTVAWDALADALSFSASRIFPFGPFDWMTRDWIHARSAQGGPGLVLLMVLIATLQTIVALTLIFLLGLAVRRRFQIS